VHATLTAACAAFVANWNPMLIARLVDMTAGVLTEHQRLLPTQPAAAAAAPATDATDAPPPPMAPPPPPDGPPPGLAERLIIVMRHIPMAIARDDDGAWTAKWDDSHLLTTNVQGGRHLLGALNLEVIFVGCIKGAAATVPRECEPAVAEMLAQYNCIPVFLPDELREGALRGFSSTVLRPLLNNRVPEHHSDSTALWQAYQRTNDAYAETATSAMRSGDMVKKRSSCLVEPHPPHHAGAAQSIFVNTPPASHRNRCGCTTTRSCSCPRGWLSRPRRTALSRSSCTRPSRRQRSGASCRGARSFSRACWARTSLGTRLSGRHASLQSLTAFFSRTPPATTTRPQVPPL
jgi:hypothetical protein